MCTDELVGTFGPEGFERSGLISFLRGLSLFRSGGDLLSHVLRRSTIGVGTLIGRVRDGIGSFALAMTTRPEKRPGLSLSRLPQTSVLFQVFVTCSTCFLTILSLVCLRNTGLVRQVALLLPDQIKPIGQLVPVS